MISKFRKSKFFKPTICFLIVSFLNQLVSPGVAFALTAGPDSPEFSSFEPVSTNQMVNDFTGNFVYNLPVVQVPGTDGGGYALSLSYHSGSNMEEEASWVGHGWTLNPGSINRNKRGFPDEFKGAQVQYYNKMRPNFNIVINKNVGVELFGADIPVAMQATTRYNNYTGFSKSIGFGVNAKGLGFIGVTRHSNGDITLTDLYTPEAVFALIKAGASFAAKKGRARANKNRKKVEKSLQSGNCKEEKKAIKKKKRMARRAKLMKKFNNAGGAGYAGNAIKSILRATIVQSANKNHATSESFGFGFSATFAPEGIPIPFPVGIEVGMQGSLDLNFEKKNKLKNAHGYMHTPNKGDRLTGPSNNSDPLFERSIVSDYYLEKESTFDKRTNIINIPFNNNDVFNLTGEGLGGSFRYHHNKVGHHYANNAVSNRVRLNTGFEVGLGLHYSFGLDLGLGYSRTNVKPWKNEGNTANYQFESQSTSALNKGFFRFSGDPGGALSYGSDALHAAKLTRESGKAKKQLGPVLDAGKIYTSVDSDKNYRSSDIKPIFTAPTSVIEPEAEISGFKITKGNGSMYSYTMPVMSKENFEYQVSVDGEYVLNNYLVESPDQLEEEDPFQQPNSVCIDRIVGQRVSTPYARTFLLESIVSPNYVDFNNDDNVDEGDLGGWTKFEYRNWASGGNYDWRSPYRGMLYSRGELSEKEDDMGMLTFGKKEVKYLKKIETKTHVAFFVTNKTDLVNEAKTYLNASNQYNLTVLQGSTISSSAPERYDGLGAKNDASYSQDLTSSSLKNTLQRLEKLEKIVVYTKEELKTSTSASIAKPISITNFEYTNELVPNVPNNSQSTWPVAYTGSNIENTGKLTLKKVWFQYNGTNPIRTSPYIFKYEYKTFDPKSDAYIKDNYKTIYDEFNATKTLAQNPTYSPENVDSWGNVQYNGKSRKKNLMTWNYQGDYTATNSFDPAAYQLKQIIMPSGAELHVQYEQKTYSKVQNRVPMAMVPMLYSEDSRLLFPKCTLNLDLSHLGLTEPGDITSYEAELEKHFVTNGNKIYFKFLYGLKKNSTGSLQDCRSEYITGYTNVYKISEQSGTIEIVLGNDNKRDKPKHAAFDYRMTRKQGRIDVCGDPYKDFGDDAAAFFGICSTGPSGLGADIEAGTENIDLSDFISDNAFFNLIKGAGETIKSTVYAGIPYEPMLHDMGKVNWGLSYLKLPMPNFVGAVGKKYDKKGGGVRVKRIFVYDSGTRTNTGNLKSYSSVGSPIIQGKEYHYVTKEGRSSGVATNEPTGMREENALVHFLAKEKQGWYDKLVNGKDRTEQEGPVGESLLPSPTIGHSRVVIENINPKSSTGTPLNSETTIGYKVKEFYTANDYPYDGYYNKISKSGLEYSSLGEKDYSQKSRFIIPTGLFNFSKDVNWASQGFIFRTNHMHGKPKTESQYGGYYGATGVNGSNVYPVSKNTYTYYEPGEEIQYLVPDDDIYKWKKGLPGMDMDVAMENKKTNNRSLDVALEFDLGIGLMSTPPIVLSAVPAFSFGTERLHTEAISQIISYPAILKSTEEMMAGVTNYTEFMAFDEHTGEPVITKTYDEFRGSKYKYGQNDPIDNHLGEVYSIKLPAHWYYQNLGPKSRNASNQNILNLNALDLTTYHYDEKVASNPMAEDDTDPTIAAWFSNPINVLSAKLTTYLNNRYTSNLDKNSGQETIYAVNGLSSIASTQQETDLNSKYSPFETYVYREDIKNPEDDAELVQTSGMYTSFYLPKISEIRDHTKQNPKIADYNPSGTSDEKWFRTNQNTTVDLDGNVVESVNAANIFSSVKMGYDRTKVILAAQNAPYNGVHFQDFEHSSDYASSGSIPTRISSEAHSGSYAGEISATSTVKLFQSPSATPVNLLVNNSQFFYKGAMVKLWVKKNSSTQPTAPEISIQVGGSSTTTHIGTSTAQVGPWYLFEIQIPNSVFSGYAPTSVRTSNEVAISLVNTDSDPIFIDDVRLSPPDAQVSCYVYDTNTGKLVAQFGDTHFGLYYQYNAEGLLIRKIIETERGMKTLEEVNYNKPKS